MNQTSLPIICLSLTIGAVVAAGETVVGTSEPIQDVDLSFPESGRIAEIPVKEGDSVKEGELLAKLETKILDASLRIAQITAGSMAAIESAEANWNLRKRRFEELERLAKSGSANKDEVARARAEFEIASADLAAVREEKESRKIEIERISAQIDRHLVTSPFAGVVTRVHRKVGEVVQPGQGPVITFVQLDRLHLVLHVDHRLARRLEPGQELPVHCLDEKVGKGEHKAKVALISPVTDAASGTTRVKLILDNQSGLHRSGLKYSIKMPDAE